MHRIALHSPLTDWKKGNLPASPMVNISLGTYSSGSNGRIFLSADLMTDREIDEAVDQLRDELEEFRRKAKSELSRLHALMREK